MRRPPVKPRPLIVAMLCCPLACSVRRSPRAHPRRRHGTSWASYWAIYPLSFRVQCPPRRGHAWRCAARRCVHGRDSVRLTLAGPPSPERDYGLPLDGRRKFPACSEGLLISRPAAGGVSSASSLSHICHLAAAQLQPASRRLSVAKHPVCWVGGRWFLNE